jgi:hypothetical protein
MISLLKVAVATKCDVMKEEDIASLAATTAEYASSSGCEVWGVVNNAGKFHVECENDAINRFIRLLLT